MSDVIVVGAGIAGAALAYECARAGARVTLLDRGPVADRGASRFGFGAVSWSAATSPATTAFARRGFDRYLGLDDEIGKDAGFRATTALTLVKEAAGMQQAAAQVARFRGEGHKAVLLDQAGLHRHEPALRIDGWAGAVTVEQGHLDLVRCARTWVEQADAGLLTVRTDVVVEAIEGNGSRLKTSAGLFMADLVFLAAGVWARPLLRTAGVDLPIYYSQAEFLYSEPAAPLLRHEVSWGAGDREAAETASIQGPRLAAWREERDEEVQPYTLEHGLIQFPDGHVRIGQLSRFVPAHRDAPDPASYALLLAAAGKLLPGVSALPGLQLGSRQVTFTPDHLPIVGPLPGMPDAIVVATSTSPVILVPAVAEALAAFATTGRWDPALAEWRLDRPKLMANEQQCTR